MAQESAASGGEAGWHTSQGTTAAAALGVQLAAGAWRTERAELELRKTELENSYMYQYDRSSIHGCPPCLELHAHAERTVGLPGEADERSCCGLHRMGAPDTCRT